MQLLPYSCFEIFGGKVNYKASAGIFAGGLIASYTGGILIVAGISNTPAAVFVGASISILGTVLLCVGAYRALAIIDALPAAFRNLTSEQLLRSQAPAQQPLHQQPRYNPPAGSREN